MLNIRSRTMKLSRQIAKVALAGILALTTAGTAFADEKTTNTILGAGLGAATGAVLSEGDVLMTLGVAAAGGLLGNILTDDHRHRHWRGYDRSYRSDRRYVDNRYYRGKHHYKRHHHKRHHRHHRHHR